MLWAWQTLAVFFAALWLWAFYREDRRREPMGGVIGTLAGGATVFVIALALELIVTNSTNLQGHTLAQRVALALLVAGPVEELLKFAVVWLFVYPRRVFDEPMDGVVYGVAAAAGFALAENLYYMVDEPAIILVRGPGATLIHILFAGFWGAALGWAKGTPDPRTARRLVLSGLLVAVLLHGLYNVVTYAALPYLSPLMARAAVLSLLVPSFFWLRRQMGRAGRGQQQQHALVAAPTATAACAGGSSSREAATILPPVGITPTHPSTGMPA